MGQSSKSRAPNASVLSFYERVAARRGRIMAALRTASDLVVGDLRLILPREDAPYLSEDLRVLVRDGWVARDGYGLYRALHPDPSTNEVPPPVFRSTVRGTGEIDEPGLVAFLGTPRSAGEVSQAFGLSQEMTRYALGRMVECGRCRRAAVAPRPCSPHIFYCTDRDLLLNHVVAYGVGEDAPNDIA